MESSDCALTNKVEHKKHKIIVTTGIDVREIRKKLGVTRAEFCERFGLKISEDLDFK